MQRLPPPRRRRAAFTLLELLVVLVLLGLSAAFVLPTLRLPSPTAGAASAVVRARATAVRRGESMRLSVEASGAWTVRSAADTLGTTLLSGDAAPGPAHSVLISAIGTCLPEGGAAADAPAWDPVSCAVSRR